MKNNLRAGHRLFGFRTILASTCLGIAFAGFVKEYPHPQPRVEVQIDFSQASAAFTNNVVPTNGVNAEVKRLLEAYKPQMELDLNEAMRPYMKTNKALQSSKLILKAVLVPK